MKPLILLVILTALVSPCVMAQEKDIPAEEEESGYFDLAREYYDKAKEKLSDVEMESLKKEVKRLYDKAKESGEEVPKDVYEWAREDIRRINAWEYKSLTYVAGSEEMMVAEMNALGLERWECFAAYPQGTEITLLFKRRYRSYLRNIPVRELMSLFPFGVGSEGASR